MQDPATSTPPQGDDPTASRFRRVLDRATEYAAGINQYMVRINQRAELLVEDPEDQLPDVPSDANGQVPLRHRRFDTGPFVLILFGVLIAIALIVSFLILGTVQTPSPEETAAGAPSAVPAETSPPAVEPTTPVPASANTAPPQIAAIAVLDPPPTGDGQENPGLTPLAMDGDQATVWRSRSYANPEFGMKPGIGLDVQLQAPAIVTEITLYLHGEGGSVQVLADPESVLDPARSVLAEVALSRTTTITLPQPTELTNVVLWFTSLPQADSDGKNRLELGEIEVR